MGITSLPLPILSQAASGINLPAAGYLLNNVTEGPPTYTLGDVIEFIFSPDQLLLSSLGSTIQVDILDICDNIITTLTANQLGNIYVAEYSIPINLNDTYNALGVDESNLNPDVFYMRDKWNIDVGTYVQFEFYVKRKIDAVDEENCVIEVFIDGLTSQDGNVVDKSVVAFTTKLTPYYATVQAVRDTNSGILYDYDNFTIARQIINQSRIIDWHMTPSKIYYADAFNHARANYARIKTATTLLLSKIQSNEEEKQIDTFRYKISTAHPKDLLEPLEKQASKFALFILAGGKDTPYVSTTFEKGLYDPNRPNLSRGAFNNAGFFPYLNTSTRSFVMNIDGNNVEVRGERATGFAYISNKYLYYDYGDVGYLARI